MKEINVQVGKVRISATDSNFSIQAEYQGIMTCNMTPDLKTALIAFTSLLIETEE